MSLPEGVGFNPSIRSDRPSIRKNPTSEFQLRCAKRMLQTTEASKLRFKKKRKSSVRAAEPPVTARFTVPKFVLPTRAGAGPAVGDVLSNTVVEDIQGSKDFGRNEKARPDKLAKMRRALETAKLARKQALLTPKRNTQLLFWEQLARKSTQLPPSPGIGGAPQEDTEVPRVMVDLGFMDGVSPAGSPRTSRQGSPTLTCPTRDLGETTSPELSPAGSQSARKLRDGDVYSPYSQMYRDNAASLPANSPEYTASYGPGQSSSQLSLTGSQVACTGRFLISSFPRSSSLPPVGYAKAGFDASPDIPAVTSARSLTRAVSSTDPASLDVHLTPNKEGVLIRISRSSSLDPSQGAVHERVLEVPLTPLMSANCVPVNFRLVPLENQPEAVSRSHSSPKKYYMPVEGAVQHATVFVREPSGAAGYQGTVAGTPLMSSRFTPAGGPSGGALRAPFDGYQTWRGNQTPPTGVPRTMSAIPLSRSLVRTGTSGNMVPQETPRVLPASSIMGTPLPWGPQTPTSPAAHRFGGALTGLVPTQPTQLTSRLGRSRVQLLPWGEARRESGDGSQTVREPRTPRTPAPAPRMFKGLFGLSTAIAGSTFALGRSQVAAKPLQQSETARAPLDGSQTFRGTQTPSDSPRHYPSVFGSTAGTSSPLARSQGALRSLLRSQTVRAPLDGSQTWRGPTRQISAPSAAAMRRNQGEVAEPSPQSETQAPADGSQTWRGPSQALRSSASAGGNRGSSQGVFVRAPPFTMNTGRNWPQFGIASPAMQCGPVAWMKDSRPVVQGPAFTGQTGMAQMTQGQK